MKRYSPGLTYADAEAIARVVPLGRDRPAPRSCSTRSITREGRRRSGKLVGVDTTYFRLTNLELGSGALVHARCRWSGGCPVAIIGNGVRTRFFTTEDPIGKPIKVGDNLAHGGRRAGGPRG